MRKINSSSLIVIILVLLGLIMNACQDEQITPKLNEEFNLKYQEEVVVSTGNTSLAVKFSEITERSLCPDDLVCVWGGRLVTELTVNDETLVVGYGDLTTNDQTPIQNVVTYGGYQITIKNVLGNKSSADDSDIILTLTISNE